MARDLSHIMRFEVERELGPYTTDEVVLYNAEHLTQQEAFDLVRADRYSDYVLCIPKRQWVALFCNNAE